METRLNEHPLAIVVVNYDCAELIEANLAPLARSDPGLGVVVVDNPSDSDARVAVTRLTDRQRWTLVEADRNDGFGSGMNLGVAEARRRGFDTFLLLNPDARIGRSDLDVLRRRLDQTRNAVLSPVVVRPDGTTWFGGGALDMRRGRTMSRLPEPGRDELPWLSGACLLISAEAWDALGGFDDDYFLYWEDVDLSVRAHRLGIDVGLVDDARAVHDEGATQRTDPRSTLSWTYYRFNIRNRLVFASKLLGPAQRRRWYLHTPYESYRVLLRGSGRRIFLRPLRPLTCGLGAVLEGLRDGRRSITRSRSAMRAHPDAAPRRQ